MQRVQRCLHWLYHQYRRQVLLSYRSILLLQRRVRHGLYLLHHHAYRLSPSLHQSLREIHGWLNSLVWLASFLASGR